MSNWLDTTIVVVIAVLGLAVMYRALKEPMDFIFSLIGKGIRAFFGMFQTESNAKEIVYNA